MNATALAEAITQVASPLARHRRDVRHLAATVDRYGNEDSIAEDGALDAMQAGRPAFWASCGYSSQIVWIVVGRANGGGSLIDVMADAYPEHRAWQREAALDALVPLNLSAAKELARAYEQFAGTFRETDELEARAA